jgi:hypothetical protein
MMRRAAAMCVVFAGTLVFTARAEAQDNVLWQAATGFDYSVGKYGGPSDTSVLSVPLSLALQSGRLRLEATLPYLDVRGPGVFTGGAVIGGSNTTTTRTGLGDLNLGAAWRLNRDSTEFPAVEIAGSIKVPTASRNLGTGKYDYTAKFNLYHSLSPKILLFGSVGYQWLTSFRNYRLENGVLASAGLNFKAAADTSIGLSASYREEYYHNLGGQMSVSPYVLWDFASNWRLSAYGVIGATRASPDYGGGLRLIFRD